MDYRLITDWTHPGLSLDFLIPVPFLILGIFLLVRGRRAEPDKGFLFGSAIVNGLIVTIISLAAFGYSLSNALTSYNDRFAFLNTNQIGIGGSISALNQSQDAYLNSIAISGKTYLLFNPIPKLRFDGQPQLQVHDQVRVLFVKYGSKSVIVKLEVKKPEGTE